MNGTAMAIVFPIVGVLIALGVGAAIWMVMEQRAEKRAKEFIVIRNNIQIGDNVADTLKRLMATDPKREWSYAVTVLPDGIKEHKLDAFTIGERDGKVVYTKIPADVNAFI